MAGRCSPMVCELNIREVELGWRYHVLSVAWRSGDGDCSVLNIVATDLTSLAVRAKRLFFATLGNVSLDMLW